MIYSNIFSKPGRIIYAVIKGSHSLRDETEKIFLSGQTHKWIPEHRWGTTPTWSSTCLGKHLVLATDVEQKPAARAKLACLVKSSWMFQRRYLTSCPGIQPVRGTQGTQSHACPAGSPPKVTLGTPGTAAGTVPLLFSDSRNPPPLAEHVKWTNMQNSWKLIQTLHSLKLISMTWVEVFSFRRWSPAKQPLASNFWRVNTPRNRWLLHSSSPLEEDGQHRWVALNCGKNQMPM